MTISTLFGAAALSIAAVYCVIVVYFYFAQMRLIYAPNDPARTPDTDPSAINLHYDSVWLESNHARIQGWWIPHPTAWHTVLFMHGNAGNISHLLETIQALHQQGVNVFVFDYQGYGNSEGTPNEENTYADAETAYQYLVEEQDINPHKILFFGRSLGGGIACWLARRHAPSALILESTYISITQLGREKYPFLPVQWLSRVRYQTVGHLEAIHCPTLVIHSQEDEKIPYAHAQTIYQHIAHDNKHFLTLSGLHYDGYSTSGNTYTNGLTAFFNQIRS